MKQYTAKLGEEHNILISYFGWASFNLWEQCNVCIDLLVRRICAYVILISKKIIAFQLTEGEKLA